MAVGSRLRHVIESQQFSRSLLEDIFARSDEIKREPHRFTGRLNGQVMAALFYEPSTRTRLSFEAAMLRLGGQTMGTDNAREFSSAAKGETLEDTIRIVSGYADVIVVRHNEEGAAKRAAAVSSVGGCARIARSEGHSCAALIRFSSALLVSPRADSKLAMRASSSFSPET